MSIRINLDVEMAKKKISSGALAEQIGITQANLSILKTGKANPFFHARSHLRSPRLSTGRYFGIRRRRKGVSYEQRNSSPEKLQL